MAERKLYRKRPKYHVTAVQLDLEFDNFSYKKWGGTQICKPGDWLVNNNDDIYTVDKEYFRDNYQFVSPGLYKKIGEVWAETATENGETQSQAGNTSYTVGDYLVFDRAQGGEGYAIKKHLFERMYEQIDEELTLTEAEQSYLANRIKPKIDDYRLKAKRNQYQYYVWQTFAIIAAALVPVFSGSTNEENAIQWIIALLGGASAVIAGLLSLFKFQENWLRHQDTYQDLDSHISQFQVSSGIYSDKKNAFSLLVENCENILKAERGEWAEVSAQGDKQKEDE